MGLKFTEKENWIFLIILISIVTSVHTLMETDIVIDVILGIIAFLIGSGVILLIRRFKR